MTLAGLWQSGSAELADSSSPIIGYIAATELAQKALPTGSRVADLVVTAGGPVHDAG